MLKNRGSDPACAAASPAREKKGHLTLVTLACRVFATKKPTVSQLEFDLAGVAWPASRLVSSMLNRQRPVYLIR